MVIGIALESAAALAPVVAAQAKPRRRRFRRTLMLGLLLQ